MAKTIFQKLRRTLFSSFELQKESGWANSIIDDYLNINDNFTIISKALDDVIFGKQTTATVTESPYNVLISDVIIWVDATAGMIIIILPPAALLPGKTCFVEKKDDSINVVRIMAQDGEDVNGDPYFDLLMQWESVSPSSTGTGWRI